MLTNEQKQAMLTAYMTCALWSSSDDDGDSLENDVVSDETAQKMREECDDFATFCGEMLFQYLKTYDAAQFGHDFWLTRNRHGAGFWDRDLGGLGAQLTDAAHTMGEVYLYVGDDGYVYQQ